MTYYFSDLLPYRKDSLISSLEERIKIAQLVIFFTTSASSAFETFRQKKYHEFDAQVSENLCQIRAYQLALIADQSPTHRAGFISISNRVNEIYIKAKTLLEIYYSIKQRRKYKQELNVKKAITFKTYIEEESFDSPLEEEEYFLIQAFILSRYKLISDYEISLGINYETLCKELLIQSKTFAKKVVHHLQRNISKLSCSFIFKLLFDLDAEQERVFLLQSLYYQDEIGRSVLPCFEVTKIILEHALKYKKEICLDITSITQKSESNFLLLLTPSDTGYALSSSTSSKEDHSLILFKGIVRYIHDSLESKEDYGNKFSEIGFEKILLCNMAQHPQYAGLGLDDKKYNPYHTIDTQGLPKSYLTHIERQEIEFLSLKQLAPKIGCTPEHPSLLLLTHIRCINSQFILHPTPTLAL